MIKLKIDNINVSISNDGNVVCFDPNIKMLVETIVSGDYFRPENGIAEVFNLFFKNAEVLDQPNEIH